MDLSLGTEKMAPVLVSWTWKPMPTVPSTTDSNSCSINCDFGEAVVLKNSKWTVPLGQWLENFFTASMNPGGPQ